MRQFAVRVDDELADRIDAARGDVPRQRWMLRAFEAALGPDVVARALDDGRIAAEDAPGFREMLRAEPSAAQPLRRGSPSPSLERFAGPRPKGGKR